MGLRVGVQVRPPAQGPRSLRKVQTRGLGKGGAASSSPVLPIPLPLGIQIPEKWGVLLCPPRRKIILFPVCLTSRAEEEDEHLERTLEQNKGKMAKKEEKCVLQ